MHALLHHDIIIILRILLFMFFSSFDFHAAFNSQCNFSVVFINVTLGFSLACV
jgi:hypothetical protein